MKKLFLILMLLFVASPAKRIVNRCVLCSVNNFKVFNSVIVGIAIFMMNNLFRRKGSVEMLTHYKSMLFNVSSFVSIRMFGIINNYIHIGLAYAAYPCVRFVSLLRLANFSFMLRRSFVSLKINTFIFRRASGRAIRYLRIFIFRDTKFLLAYKTFLNDFSICSSAIHRTILCSIKSNGDNMKFLSTRQTGFLHNISFLMLIIIASACLCNYSFAGQWDKQVPLATSSWVDFPSQSKANNDSIDRLLAGYREGLTLSYSSATAIAVSAGEVMVSDAAGTTRLMLRNASAATVTFSDLDVGSESPSTTYYIYAGATSTAAETITLKISASSTAPTSLTYFKRLGSFYNDASSNIEQYSMSNYAYVSPKDLLSSFKVYDSGWFSFSASASYAKTHNLGTTKLLITIYASTSSTGATYVSMPVAYNGDGSARQILSNVTTTTLTLKTYDGVWMNNYSNITSGYFRVIVMALE